jgi:hypothetical protein
VSARENKCPTCGNDAVRCDELRTADAGEKGNTNSVGLTQAADVLAEMVEYRRRYPGNDTRIETALDLAVATLRSTADQLKSPSETSPPTEGGGAEPQVFSWDCTSARRHVCVEWPDGSVLAYELDLNRYTDAPEVIAAKASVPTPEGVAPPSTTVPKKVSALPDVVDLTNAALWASQVAERADIPKGVRHAAIGVERNLSRIAAALAARSEGPTSSQKTSGQATRFSETVMCRKCGKPTMHMGDICFLCSKAEPPLTSKTVQPTVAPSQPEGREVVLIECIAAAAVRAGIIRPDARIDGPTAMQLCNDLATAAATPAAPLTSGSRTPHPKGAPSGERES